MPDLTPENGVKPWTETCHWRLPLRRRRLRSRSPPYDYVLENMKAGRSQPARPDGYSVGRTWEPGERQVRQAEAECARTRADPPTRPTSQPTTTASPYSLSCSHRRPHPPPFHLNSPVECPPSPPPRPPRTSSLHSHLHHTANTHQPHPDPDPHPVQPALRLAPPTLARAMLPLPKRPTWTLSRARLRSCRPCWYTGHTEPIHIGQ